MKREGVAAEEAGAANLNMAQAIAASLGANDIVLAQSPCAILDYSGLNIFQDAGLLINQNWVRLLADAVKISRDGGSGPLFSFDPGDSVNNQQFCGISGCWVIDVKSHDAPALLVRNAPFFDLTGSFVAQNCGTAAAGQFSGSVSPRISNFFAQNGAGPGLVLDATPTKGPPAESQGACILNLKGYMLGGPALWLHEGGGHRIFGIDMEVCGTAGQRVSSSFGNCTFGAYAEANAQDGAGPDVLVDEADGIVEGRNTFGNTWLGGYLTSGVGIDVAKGDRNGFDGMVVTGDIRNTASRTVFGPTMRVYGSLEDEGFETAKWYWSDSSPERYVKVGHAKRWTHRISEFIDVGGDKAVQRYSQLLSLSGCDTPRMNFRGSVRFESGQAVRAASFPRPEIDPGYHLFLSLVHGRGGTDAAADVDPPTAAAGYDLTPAGFMIRLDRPAGPGGCSVSWLLIG